MQHCVTILMPCFNASKYLVQALQSILEQNHQNLIVILLDDGSTDDSLPIARHIAQTDKRVQIHCNSENLGIIKSRNKLLDLCSTDYAAWMDCDDIAYPERITKQLQFMLEHPDYVACTCHYIRQGLGEDKMITIPSETISREYLLFYNYVLNPGSFFDVVRCKYNKVQFRERISGASDYLFWVELAKFGQIGVVADTLMVYRLHPEQETVAQKKRQLAGVLEIVQYQLAQFDCQADTQDLARLLIYPADILKLEYRLHYLKKSAVIINAIMAALPSTNYDHDCVESLLFNMYRRQAWRVGVLGFWQFVWLYKFEGLILSRHFGLTLLLASIKHDLTRFVSILKGNR